MATTVRERDRGSRRLERALAELEAGVSVTVGVHADVGAEEHHDSNGATVADVATFTELGTRTQPPRSWLRAVIDERRAQLGEALSKAAAEALRGTDARQAFATIATELATAMRARVSAERGQVREAIEGRVDGERVG